MISDEQAIQRFQKILESPAVFGGRGSLQIVRGKSPHLWKDAHPGECHRHMALFKQSDTIPEYCFGCYKVLVEPRTVVELFKLLIVFEEINLSGNNTRKCMVENRDYCSGAYKGYVYCRGLEEGKIVRKHIREAVADLISPHAPVTVKRGCSEFEQAHPAYGQIKLGTVPMRYPEAWRAREQRFDREFPSPAPAEDLKAVMGESGTYPPSEIYAMRYWLSYAATVGDNSYVKLAGRTIAKLAELKRPPFNAATPRRTKQE